MFETENYDKITDFISLIAKENGYRDDHSLEVIPLVEKGEGFLGQIFFVTIKNKENGLALDIVVKLSLTNIKARQQFHIRDFYENEIYFYTDIYPAFEKFQRENEIHNGFNEVVKYYGCYLKNDYEILALENIKRTGFELFNKKKLFDKEHMTALFKTYAKLHATSFAYRDQKPEEFKKLIKAIKIIFGTPSTYAPFKVMVEMMFQELEEILSTLGNANLTEKFRMFYKSVDEHHQVFTHYSGEYGAILHSDCWSNNMMFKYETPVSN